MLVDTWRDAGYAVIDKRALLRCYTLPLALRVMRCAPLFMTVASARRYARVALLCYVVMLMMSERICALWLMLTLSCLRCLRAL